jgi:hypothetical protein
MGWLEELAMGVSLTVKFLRFEAVGAVSGCCDSAGWLGELIAGWGFITGRGLIAG